MTTKYNITNNYIIKTITKVSGDLGILQKQLPNGNKNLENRNQKSEEFVCLFSSNQYIIIVI